MISRSGIGIREQGSLGISGLVIGPLLHLMHLILVLDDLRHRAVFLADVDAAKDALERHAVFDACAR